MRMDNMDFHNSDGDPFDDVEVNVPEVKDDDEATDNDNTQSSTEATVDDTSDSNDLLTKDRAWVDKTLQRDVMDDCVAFDEEVDLPEGRFTFLPGLGYVVANCAIGEYRGRDEGNLEGKRLTWWNEDSITQHFPYMLINPIPMASTLSLDPETMPDGEFTHFREIFDYWPDEQWVISDSGGFQVMSRGGEVVDDQDDHSFKNADIHPPTLAEWQVKAADAGTMLDMPPYIITPNEDPRGDSMDLQFSEWVDQVFDPSLEQSVENARRMQERWDDIGTPAFERFGVIQGQPASAVDDMDDWALLRRWHESIEDVGEWDGMALKPHPFSDFGNIAFFLGYASDFLQDYNKIHVLQVGSIHMESLLMYYSMLTGQEVTSDGTGYNMGSQYRSYTLPVGSERRMVLSERDHHDGDVKEMDRNELAERRMTEGKDIATARRDIDVVNITEMPCSCEVCSHIDEVSGPELFIEEDGNVQAATLLNLHNLQRQLEVDHTIQSIIRGVGVDVPDGLIVQERSVKAKKNLYWEVMSDIVTDSKLIHISEAMKFIRMAYEEGIEEASRVWSIPWFKESSGGIHRGNNAMNNW